MEEGWLLGYLAAGDVSRDRKIAHHVLPTTSADAAEVTERDR